MKLTTEQRNLMQQIAANPKAPLYIVAAPFRDVRRMDFFEKTGCAAVLRATRKEST